MQKIVIIPDSFKGTISSGDAGKIIEEEVRSQWPEAEVIRAEVADGGASAGREKAFGRKDYDLWRGGTDSGRIGPRSQKDHIVSRRKRHE